MPTQDRHVAQAAHNNEMLIFIDTYDSSDSFRDWYTTVSYYTALHHFEAILPIVVPEINKHRTKSLLETHYYGHEERLKAMADYEFVDIYRPYSSLHKFSKAARYNNFDTTRFTKTLVKKYLTDVEIACKKVKGKYL